MRRKRRIDASLLIAPVSPLSSPPTSTSWKSKTVLSYGFMVLLLCRWLWMTIRSSEGGDRLNHNGGVTTTSTRSTATSAAVTFNSTKSVASKPITIAYVTVVTGCGGLDSRGRRQFPITEGAAVLQYSIHRSSVHGNRGGRYDYEMYALYHPEAENCSAVLQDLGYRTIKSPVPISVDEIKGEYLRERIVQNGCCGEKELIKLEAFRFTQYPVVVLLDLDVVIFKPIDFLFDIILYGRIPGKENFTFPDGRVPRKVDILHTTDYGMVSAARKVKPFQGGFVILRPNKTVYNELIDIVREGDFRDQGGWGGHTGKFWGSMTFQGLLPYYFHVLSPGRSLELNYCIHNNMVSPNQDSKGRCFTEQCDDCRLRPVQDLFSTHFTVCLKPWNCQSYPKSKYTAPKFNLCRELHHEWFRLRSEMETSWGRSGEGDPSITWERDFFFGYCRTAGRKGYIDIQEPFRKPLPSELSRN